MPLSEEEQRMLDQLEQALTADDPKFASALRGSKSQGHHRRVALSAGGVFVIGIGLLMTGVILPQTVVSVLGFVLMLGGAYIGLTAWRRSTQPEPLYLVGSSDQPKAKSASASKRQHPSASGSFMERMEERWRRRRESGF
ncbi:MAG: DUF3040 domain-containing protein [Propionibacteriales bacterium]|nr:DUF3040 domain-containing protein [Propionibacteriales bacterium]